MDLTIANALLDGRTVTVEVRDGVIREVRGEEAGDGGREAGGRRAGGAGVPGAEGAPREAAHLRRIDASGLHLFPAFRNGHTHAAMTLFRGWGDDLPLMEWLRTRIWPAEARMTEVHVYRGTRLALLEMIRSGTVHLNDMYWHSGAVGRAVEEMGVRAHLGSVFIDLGDEAIARKWKAQVEGELEALGDLSSRLRRTIAPHAIYTVSPENLSWLGERAREHGLLLHIHLSETEEEVAECVARHGVRPAFLLERCGVLGDNLVAAHGCWLDPEELALLGEAGATVVTNPTANLKLATGGIFDHPTARAAGVRVVLGTDGAGSNNNLDLVEEMKMAALVQKHRARDATVLPAHEALQLATEAPARLFGHGTGRVEVGEPADLVLVDLSGPGTQPGHDPVSDLVYAAHGGCVHTTICDGRVLMHDRVVEVVDEAEVIREARAAATELVAG